MKISKKYLSSLIDDVVLKYQVKYLTEYIDTEDIKAKHDLLITKFAVMFFANDVKKLEKNFKSLLAFYDDVCIPVSNIRYALANFYQI